MLKIRVAVGADLTRIVEIHQVCFPNETMTLFGQNGLAGYYRFFIEDPAGICLVAESDHTIVGFVSGWLRGATYQRPLMRAYGLQISLGFLRSLPKHPGRSVRLLWNKSALILKSFINSRKQVQVHRPVSVQGAKDQATPARISNASLLSIALLPEFRGSGIAAGLSQQFIVDCAKTDVKFVSLTVNADNLAARKFYEKTGWSVHRERGQVVHYRYPLKEKA